MKLILNALLFLFVSVANAEDLQVTQLNNVKPVITEIKCNSMQKCTSIYDVYMPDLITERSNFQDLFYLLDRAVSTDVFRIHLVGRGGDVITTTAILSSLNNTRGFVLGVVDAEINSAYVYITLQLKRVQIRASYGEAMMHRSVDNTGQYFCAQSYKGESLNKSYCSGEEKFVRQIMTGIYTTAEINHVLNFEELYISLEDLKNRLRKVGRLVE